MLLYRREKMKAILTATLLVATILFFLGTGNLVLADNPIITPEMSANQQHMDLLHQEFQKARTQEQKAAIFKQAEAFLTSLFNQDTQKQELIATRLQQVVTLEKQNVNTLQNQRSTILTDAVAKELLKSGVLPAALRVDPTGAPPTQFQQTLQNYRDKFATSVSEQDQTQLVNQTKVLLSEIFNFHLQKAQAKVEGLQIDLKNQQNSLISLRNQKNQLLSPPNITGALNSGQLPKWVFPRSE